MFQPAMLIALPSEAQSDQDTDSTYDPTRASHIFYTTHLSVSFAHAYNSLVTNRAKHVYTKYQAIPEEERAAYQKPKLQTYLASYRTLLKPIRSAAYETLQSHISSLARSHPAEFTDTSNILSATPFLYRGKLWD